MEQAKIKTPKNTGELAQTAAKAVAPVKTKNAIDYLSSESFKKQLEMALPKFLDTDHFVRSAISDFRLNPALQECSVPSVLGFYMQAAMCGLEPSSVLGQCYPVPFKNKKTGAPEAQFILGYRGMASIARRSGDVANIDAKVVYEKDEFELEYGLEQVLRHKPYLDGDRGSVRGAYCVVTFKDGNKQYAFMPKVEIDKHRSRSKSSTSGPWVTDYEEMAKKTVFRSVFKWLPISIEQAQAISKDDSVARVTDNYTAATPDDFIEVEFVAAEPDLDKEDKE